MDENIITHMFTRGGLQLAATLIATLSAISDGMHYGWSAPVIPILQSDDSPIKISKNEEVWLETSYLLAEVVGLPITIFLIDKIGRKNSIMATSAVSLLAWIIIALADRVAYLYVARFSTGVASVVAFVATPMYVAEIAEPKIRGFLSGCIYIMMLIGVLVVYSVAPFVPFYVPSLVGGLLLITQLVIFPFMPESPYHYLMIGKKGLARASLNKLRGQQDNESELEEITEGLERQRKEKARIQELFLVRTNRKAFIIVLVLTAAQHFCGISVMLMNLHSILTETGSIYLSANAAAIVFASIMLAAATASSFFIDKYGRKVLLTSSSVLTGVCLVVLALYFHLKHLGNDVQSVSWVPLVCVMVYAAVFKYGLGLVPIVIASELFSTKIKALGISLTDGFYGTFGLLSIEVYQRLGRSYGYHVPFYLFGVIAFLVAAFTASAIPETKGKSLEEIQLLLKGHARNDRSEDDSKL